MLDTESFPVKQHVMCELCWEGDYSHHVQLGDRGRGPIRPAFVCSFSVDLFTSFMCTRLCHLVQLGQNLIVALRYTSWERQIF